MRGIAHRISAGGRNRYLFGLAAGALFAVAPLAHGQTTVVNIRLKTNYSNSPYLAGATYGPGNTGTEALTDPNAPNATNLSAYYDGTGVASDPGTFWNSTSNNYEFFPAGYPVPNNTYGTAYALTGATDSNGDATPTSINLIIAGDAGFVYQTSANRSSPLNLFGGWAGSGTSFGNGVIQLTGLAPSASYQLYLYGGVSTFSITGSSQGSESTSLDTTNSSNGSAFGAAGSNWVLFTGTASPTGEVDGTYLGNISALQIIETASVPEPASLGLLSIASMGLVARRRRA